MVPAVAQQAPKHHPVKNGQGFIHRGAILRHARYRWLVQAGFLEVRQRTQPGTYHAPTRNEVDVLGKGLRRMYIADPADAFEDLLRQIDDADRNVRIEQVQTARSYRAR